ncbi:MAG: beta-ketoacyl reductase, partial [Bacteroidota bacterium]
FASLSWAKSILAKHGLLASFCQISQPLLRNLTKRNDTSSSGDSLYPRINLADWVEEFYFDDLNILAKLDDKKSKALETGFYSNTVLLESIFKLISQELSIKSYPESIKRFRIFKPIDKEVWVHITHDSSSDAHVFNIKVIDVEGEVYLEIDGVKYEEIDRLNYPTLSDEIQEFNLNQKIFKVAEQQLNLADKAIGNRGSDFVIFGSPGNAVNHIPEIFQSADIKCIKVNYGDQFCKIDDRNYCIDPMNADDYDQLWKSLEGVQISDVLHSFSVKSGDSQSNEIHSVFNLIKSVNKLDLLNSSLGLTLVSNVGNEFYSALRGLSKVISQEDLFTSVNHIEINDDVSNRQLISEALFTDAHGNHTITLKQEDVFSTGLELIKNTCSTDTDFDKNKFCLITGGSGDLSEDIIQSLRDLGLNRFVLISRRGNSDCQIKKMQLRYGVEAQSIQADVADLSDLKKKLANFAGQIGGVVHAAGFLKPDILSDQSFSDFSDHMIPKVRGLTNLSKITSGEKIDYFVCFSSLSSIIGGKGLGAYATANSAVDILMQQRAKQNLASTSINWGPIEGTSMAEQIPISNAHTGIRGLSRSDFRDILKKVILNKDEQILAVNVDFDQFKKVFHFNQESEEPFEKLKFEQLITLDENQLSNQILDVVQNLVEGLLGLKMLATDKNLFDVGIDSLMLTELRGLILKYFNVSISMALFYSKPTLIEITNEITNKIIDMKTDVKDYQGVAI